MTGMRTMTESDCPDCPYGAERCPKVSDLETTVIDLVHQMRKMNNYLMVIIGIMAVECGIVIL